MKPQRRLGLLSTAAIVALLVSGLPSPARVVAAGSGATIDPAVTAALAQIGTTGTTRVIVVLRDQLDPRSVAGGDRNTRLRAVVSGLRAKADVGQRGLRALLSALQSAGLVTSFTPLWIQNAIAVTGRSAVITDLALRPEVAAIIPDRSFQAPPRPAPASVAPVEPNLGLVNAPALWNLGATGQGVVIASLDTGVDTGHPDIAARWRGGTDSWYDPYGQHATPTDVSGHGTWTMGLMVGGSYGGTSIGVAPGASWIAAKIFNDAGTATSAAIHLAYQWVLDPDGNPATADAPNIVNDSWTFGAPGCDLSFEPDLGALVSGGITPVFAAGNFGAAAQTDASPANNPDAFAVGATDDSDVIASFSSRGPTSCGRPAPTTYPAVVAPGVTVNTTDLYGLYTTVTGTSFSAPHVAAGLALLAERVPGPRREPARDGPHAERRRPRDRGPGLHVRRRPDRPSRRLHPHRLGRRARADTHPGSDTDAHPDPDPDPDADPDAHPDAHPDSDTHTHTHADPDTHADPGADARRRRSGRHRRRRLLRSRTQGGATIAISATASDPASPGGPSRIAAAEWFEGVDPGPGRGTPMAASDGAYDSPSEALSGTVATAGLAYGEHVLWLRAKDAAGNWGSTTPLATSVTPADGIFADGFEGGTTSAWTSATGNVSVTPSAAAAGRYGLAVTVAGSASAYVSKTLPVAVTSFRARFSFAPNGIRISRDSPTDIFVGRSGGGTTLLRLQYSRSSAGTPQVRASVARRFGTATTGWVSVADAATTLEIGLVIRTQRDHHPARQRRDRRDAHGDRHERRRPRRGPPRIAGRHVHQRQRHRVLRPVRLRPDDAARTVSRRHIARGPAIPGPLAHPRRRAATRDRPTSTPPASTPAEPPRSAARAIRRCRRSAQSREHRIRTGRAAGGVWAAAGRATAARSVAVHAGSTPRPAQDSGGRLGARYHAGVTRTSMPKRSDRGRALGPAVAAAAVGAGLLFFLAGPLGVTSGLLIVTAATGWIVGLAVKSQDPARTRPAAASGRAGPLARRRRRRVGRHVGILAGPGGHARAHRLPRGGLRRYAPRAGGVRCGRRAPGAR